MPFRYRKVYREKKIYSGDILEVEIYPIDISRRKESRAKKEKLSVPKQRNINDKNAKKHLIRLINSNFTDEDLAVHLTYTEKTLPKSEEQAKKDVSNFIRRVKYHIKKHSLPELKYIAVVEYKESDDKKKSVRMHHHLVMNGVIDRDILEDLWGNGRANADRLKSDEYGYEGLARYITKDPRGSKRWTQSRNLKQPEVSVNDHRFSKRKIEDISRNSEDKQQFYKLYPDYILNDCKVSFNDVTAEKYLYIRLRKIKD